jgi:Family of unknown function (DUF5706)
MATMEERKIEFLRSHFDMVESQVQFGDQKASLLIAGDAILLAICGGLIGIVSGCPKDGLRVSCMEPSFSLGLATIAAALLICSMLCALIAALPSRVFVGKAKEPYRHFLLPHIAREKEPDAFIKEFERASDAVLVKEALIAIHGKARFATRKFRLLICAVAATFLSLAFIVVTLLVAVVPHVLA